MGSRSWWGPEFDRIAAGGLPWSTERRLRELTRRGGTTSFFSAAESVTAEAAGVSAVGQVVGLAAGHIAPGYLPGRQRFGRVLSGRPGERPALDGARWREHPRIVEGWTILRRRALGRLSRQAELLRADAVIGVRAARRFEPSGEEGWADAIVHFTGTAVRVDAWARRHQPPVLTLVSAQELGLMLSTGIEPVGIVGGFARIELTPSDATIATSRMRGRMTPNRELEDLTQSVYEARRLALRRLVADTATLKASGVIGINLDLERSGSSTRRLPGVVFTAHVVATAVRRTGRTALVVQPVIEMSDEPRG